MPANTSLRAGRGEGEGEGERGRGRGEREGEGEGGEGRGRGRGEGEGGEGRGRGFAGAILTAFWTVVAASLSLMALASSSALSVLSLRNSCVLLITIAMADEMKCSI